MNDSPQLNYWLRHVRDNNLAYLEYLSGNIDKAIALCNNIIEEGKEHDFTWGMFRSMSQLADHLMAKGQLQEAKQLHIQSLGYRKQHSNPVEATLGYYNLIRLLTIEYQLTNNVSLVLQAKDFFSQMTLLSNKYPSNVTVTNYTKINGALIGKFGRLKDRANAIQIFEKMIDLYPKYYNFKLDLLELLFEEA